MKITFNYIKNRIAEYRKSDIFNFCYRILENEKKSHFPIWYIFILMKWTFKYGESRYPSKPLTQERFAKLYNAISNFNDDHITNFMREKKIDRAFLILYNQQFYLQKSVYNEIFATQLKLFSKLKSKYDIEKSFQEKSGFTIKDFLFIKRIVWMYINMKELDSDNIYFEGYLDDDFLKVVAEITSVKNINCFLKLLTLNPNNIEESISNFRHKITNENFQTMEMSFFIMFPFQIYQGKFRLIHESIFKTVINYYLYDFLKQNDEMFTTEFGYRVEKYIALGLNELNINFKTEKDLKRILDEKSNLVDFYVVNDNIFIECKATELQAYPSVNPTDELLYNSLKSSIFKAYFEQLTTVARKLNPNSQNWGIIITYKELFWSHFVKLFEIGKDKYDNIDTFTHLPPENVFIIDLYTWDKIVQIVKDKKATLLEILQNAKKDNSNHETSKQLFDMHLDQYKLETMNLTYLQDEIAELNF